VLCNAALSPGPVAGTLEDAHSRCDVVDGSN